MNAIVPAPKLASSLKALWAAFSEPTYLSLVLAHNLAAELGSEQIAAAYRSGTWPAPDWAQQSLERARVDRRLLKRSLIMSATLAGLLALLAVLAAIILGKVHPSLPADPGKSLAALGAGLLAWAAFLPLYPARPSFCTNLLHEVAHATLLKALLGVGTTFAAIGALWWQ
jgi:hypothetical protein